jgi:hypothetical protein
MKFIVGLLFVVSLFGTCNPEIMSDSNLPKEHENISIRWNENGGMVHFSEKIEISKDSCIYEINRQGNLQRIVFQLTKEQIDSLYTIFRKNKFDKIKTYEEEILDRGGSSIYLTVDNQNYTVSNSGFSIIEKDWAAQYNGIENAIRKIAFEELENHKFDVLIEIDQTILDNEYYVKIQIDESIILFESKESDYKQDSVKLFDENNEISVYFQYYKDDKTDYLSVEKRFEYLLPNLPDDKKIILAIENEKLVVK